MTTPQHQVFRHNMRLLLENLDKNEVSLQDISDILAEYSDFKTRFSKLGNFITEDMLNNFLASNMLIEVKERKDIDGIILYTLMLDNFVQVSLIHNVESQDTYVSSFIKVFRDNKFILYTGTRYLENYYNMVRLACPNYIKG